VGQRKEERVTIRRGTYSIVARDVTSGELGVAVQSHWFSVGSIVTWGRAGVGVVATQSVAEPAYGPRLLEQLANGAEPRDALAGELEGDELAGFRQVATVDVSGRVAAHTGDGCIRDAGHQLGDGYSTQANLMASPGVWSAMAEAFEGAEGPLARRLLAALEAGEAAGGDVRGRQSAAILVVPARGEAWERTVELRVEDAPDPLAELARLLDLHDAYALADQADSLAANELHREAAEMYRRAAAGAPESIELRFWAGLGMAAAGELERGAAEVEAAFAAHDGWRRLLARLKSEIAPAAGAVRERLGVEAEGELKPGAGG
jgi:uncharacterized Ntn-hydrolase superfamily protein